MVMGTETTTRWCKPVLPAGYVGSGGDCDDINPMIHPNADEYYNSMDDDCDGTIDNDAIDAPTWYYDIDGDGFEVPSSPPTTVRNQPDTWLLTSIVMIRETPFIQVP